MPEFPGSHLMLSSNDIFTMQSMPQSLLVLGGGYIAVEFASILARLGCKISLVYRGNQLLRGFDSEIRQLLTAQIGANVRLYLNNGVKKIRKKNNDLKALLNNGSELTCNAALSATGRKPATVGLGLETANVTTDRNGAILVDDSFQTSARGISAIGDVIDRVALTTVALAQAQVLMGSLFSDQPGVKSFTNIPTAVFCEPNIAIVGLSEDEALARGMKLDVYSKQVNPFKIASAVERRVV